MFSRATSHALVRRWPCLQCQSRRSQLFYSTSTPEDKWAKKQKAPDKINYNPLTFNTPENDKPPEGASLPMVTANSLAETHKEPPRGVQMLVRDFIEDSLYHPNYGYFSKQAHIFSAVESPDRPGAPMDYGAFRDNNEFQDAVARRYATLESDTKGNGPGKQIWHTPTELFQPFYGHAIARCLVSEYLLKYFPYEDLVIYEIGAGNGTLALNILDFIKAEYPEVYERTRYHIVEISRSLSERQKARLSPKHADVVKVHNTSVFRWRTREPAPCFFLALEVVDNFAHDLVRYDLRNLTPLQAHVAIDENGDFSAHYSPIQDPLIAATLGLRSRLGHAPHAVPSILRNSPLARKAYTALPFAPNLSTAEWLPTRLVSLLSVLRTHFPSHRLLLSDFSTLPDALPGVGAPVVQTRVQGETVPCETFLVQQGAFDIFFPTDFARLRDMYEHVLAHPNDALPLPSPLDPGLTADQQHGRRSSPYSTSSPLSLGSSFFSSHTPPSRRAPMDGIFSTSGLPVGERKSAVFSHRAFLETYADLDATRLRNGENPMLEYYENVDFLF